MAYGESNSRVTKIRDGDLAEVYLVLVDSNFIRDVNRQSDSVVTFPLDPA